MMNRTVRASAVAGALLALVAGGCATGGSSSMTPQQAIAARQQLMKDQGALMKAISAKAKAGQIQAIAADAEKLVGTSHRIATLFPEGSLDPDTSRAKPEIWQKRTEFEGYAGLLGTKATQLAALAQKGDPTTGAAVADLGKTTCGACHNAFRGPELKKK